MPPIWIGYTATIALPLAKKPFLVPWQFVRMLRPWVAMALPIYLMYVMSQERDRWGSPLRKLSLRQFQIVESGIAIGMALGLWFGLEYLFNRFEFVRLLYFNRTDGLVKVRFAKASVARRASEVLVFPKTSVS